MDHSKILKVIETIRGPIVSKKDEQMGIDPQDTSYHIMVEVFTKGNCGNLAIALTTAFGGEMWLVNTLEGKDAFHVVAEVDGRLYDIHGDVTDKYKKNIKVDEKYVRHFMFADNYSFAERGAVV